LAHLVPEKKDHQEMLIRKEDHQEYFQKRESQLKKNGTMIKKRCKHFQTPKLFQQKDEI
jgi:hypothetical protein